MTPDPTTGQPRWTVDDDDILGWGVYSNAETAWFEELPDEAYADLAHDVRLAAEVPALRARLEAAEAVIRRLLDGWEPLNGQWRNEAEVDFDGVAVRSPMTDAEAEAIARARGDQP